MLTEPKDLYNVYLYDPGMLQQIFFRKDILCHLNLDTLSVLKRLSTVSGSEILHSIANLSLGEFPNSCSCFFDAYISQAWTGIEDIRYQNPLCKHAFNHIIRLEIDQYTSTLGDDLHTLFKQSEWPFLQELCLSDNLKHFHSVSSLSI